MAAESAHEIAILDQLVVPTLNHLPCVYNPVMEVLLMLPDYANLLFAELNFGKPYRLQDVVLLLTRFWEKYLFVTSNFALLFLSILAPVVAIVLVNPVQICVHRSIALECRTDLIG
jgi:hypothetical protein